MRVTQSNTGFDFAAASRFNNVYLSRLRINSNNCSSRYCVYLDLYQTAFSINAVRYKTMIVPN